MNIDDALDTTRMMRRLRPDPIPRDAQARIFDAASTRPTEAEPSAGTSWLEDPALIREFAELFRQGRDTPTLSAAG